MAKVNVYVDGFNLYYGALKGTPYKWLDLARLCQALLPSDTIQEIKYFTARVSARPSKPTSAHDQGLYIRALRTLPNLTIKYGHFLTHTVPMYLATVTPPQRVWVEKTEEKGSDVNLASHLVRDAFSNQFEVAVLITNDSDLAEPVRIVSQELHMPVGILNPHQHHSKELQRYAKEYEKIESRPLNLHVQLALSEYQEVDARTLVLPDTTFRDTDLGICRLVIMGNQVLECHKPFHSPAYMGRFDAPDSPCGSVRRFPNSSPSNLDVAYAWAPPISGSGLNPIVEYQVTFNPVTRIPETSSTLPVEYSTVTLCPRAVIRKSASLVLLSNAISASSSNSPPSVLRIWSSVMRLAVAASPSTYAAPFSESLTPPRCSALCVLLELPIFISVLGLTLFTLGKVAWACVTAIIVEASFVYQPCTSF